MEFKSFLSGKRYRFDKLIVVVAAESVCGGLPDKVVGNPIADLSEGAIVVEKAQGKVVLLGGDKYVSVQRRKSDAPHLFLPDAFFEHAVEVHEGRLAVSVRTNEHIQSFDIHAGAGAEVAKVIHLHPTKPGIDVVLGNFKHAC